MIIKYRKCKSYHEFTKIFRKYYNLWENKRRIYGKYSMECPWWIWLEYDILSIDDLKKLQKSLNYLFYTSGFLNKSLKRIVNDVIDNYGKDFSKGKLVGIQITNEDYYYIYQKENGYKTFDSCVSKIK